MGHVPLLHFEDVGENGCTYFTNPPMYGSEVLEFSYIPLFKVQTTRDISLNATEFDMQAAVQDLSGACLVTVEKTEYELGYSWTVTFLQPQISGLLVPMRANGDLLRGIVFQPQVEVMGLMSFVATGLKSGVPYFVNVSASNKAGRGLPTLSSPVSLQPSLQEPAAPQNVVVDIVSNSQLMVQWEPPLSDGGDQISAYMLDWDVSALFDTPKYGSMEYSPDSTSPVSDIQIIRISASVGKHLTGSFRLEFNGQFTRDLAVSISAVDLKRALESLCTIQQVEVSRNIGPAPGFSWIVTFLNPIGDQYRRYISDYTAWRGYKLAVDGSMLLVCEDAKLENCKNNQIEATADLYTKQEVQRLQCFATQQFQLKFQNKYTALISNTAAVSEIEAALENLELIGDVNVTLSAGNHLLCNGDYLFVTFLSNNGDQPSLISTIDGSFTELVKGNTQMAVGRLPYNALIPVTDVEFWFVRIRAKNIAGWGAPGLPFPQSYRAAIHSPSVIRNLTVHPVTTNLVIGWDDPLLTGGVPINQFIVEWDILSSFDSVCGDAPAIQSLSLTSSSPLPTDTFTLIIGNIQVTGPGSSCFPWNTSALVLRNRIRVAHPWLEAVTVTRGGDGSSAWDYGYVYSITFGAPNGSLEYQSWDLISASGAAGCHVDSASYTSLEVQKGGGLKGTCSAQHRTVVGRAFVPIDVATCAGSCKLKYAYTAPSLTPGKGYYVRVAAENDMGYSPWAFYGYPSQPLLTVLADVPFIVQNISLRTDSNSSLRIDYTVPYENRVTGCNGAPIEKYKVELSTRQNEIQIVYVSKTFGDFRVKFKSEVTLCIAWGSSAFEISCSWSCCQI